MTQNSPQPMNKQAEETLLSAIRGVSEAVESGMAPTDAVVKVARQHDLNRNMLPLVVQAYNVGRTTWQQDNSEGILGKQASFPLARIEDVVSELYPQSVATPAEEKSAAAVASVYSRPPSVRPRDEVTFEKAAYATDIRLPEEQRVPDNDPFERLSVKVAKAFGEISREKKALAEMASDERLAQHNYLASLGLVREYFKQSEYLRKPFAEVEHNTRLLFGEPGVHALDYAYISNRMKEAKAQGPPRYLAMASETDEPYSLIAQVIKCGHELLRTHREVKQLEKRADEVIGSALRPFSPAPGQSVSILGGQPIRSSAMDNRKLAGFLSNITSASAGAAMRGSASKPQDSLVRNAEDALTDPDHMAELRGIETRTMLEDLMHNDEVIAGYEPEEILSAYNEIAQLTPRAASQAAVIRPLLRKRLTQGAMEPFEAQQMAEIEKTIGAASPSPAEAKQPSPQGAGGKNVLAENPLFG